jgi:hypothetical protein
MANNLYGPFALNPRFKYDHAACPACHVRITTYGKKLPEAIELVDAYERSLVFHLDKCYYGELVELSLENITQEISKPNGDVHVEFMRKNHSSVSQKGASVVQFRNPEHSVITLCIRSDETVCILCQLPGYTKNLVVVVKFIISG